MKSRRKESCGWNILFCAVLRTSGNEVSDSDTIIPLITGDHRISAHSNMYSGINRNLHKKTNLLKWKKKKKKVAQKPNNNIFVNHESYLLIAKVIMKWCPPYYFSLSLQNHSLSSSVTITQTLTEDQWAPSANTEIKGAEAEQILTGNFRLKEHPRSTTKYSITWLLVALSSMYVFLPLYHFFLSINRVKWSYQNLYTLPHLYAYFITKADNPVIAFHDWKELLLKANTIIPPFSSICPTSLWLTAKAVPRIALISI